MAEPSLSAEGTIRSSQFEHEGRRVRLILMRNLILAAALLGVLGVVFQQWIAPPEVRAQRRSSFSTRADGFRGLHEVSKRLGYRVERHLDSFGALPKPPEDYTLLVIDPLPAFDLAQENKTRLGPAQFRALKQWIEAGGNAVVAMPGRSSYQFLGAELDTSGRQLVERLTGPRDLVPGLLGGIAPVASWMPMFGTLRGEAELEGLTQTLPELKDDDAHLVSTYLRRGGEFKRLVRFVDPGEEPLQLLAFNPSTIPAGMHSILALGDRSVAVTQEMGAGKLWLLSTSFPLTNMALARGEWADPVYALVDAASDRGARTLVFDEYTHGLWARKGMLAIVAQSDLRYPLSVGLLLAILIGWRGSVRVGAPIPLRTVPRRAKEEFVISLADLAQRAGRYGAAARWLYDAYRDRLPPPGSSPTVDRLASRAKHSFNERELRQFADSLTEAAAEHERRARAPLPRPTQNNEG